MHCPGKPIYEQFTEVKARKACKRQMKTNARERETSEADALTIQSGKLVYTVEKKKVDTSAESAGRRIPPKLEGGQQARIRCLAGSWLAMFNPTTASMSSPARAGFYPSPQCPLMVAADLDCSDFVEEDVTVVPQFKRSSCGPGTLQQVCALFHSFRGEACGASWTALLGRLAFGVALWGNTLIRLALRLPSWPMAQLGRGVHYPTQTLAVAA